MIWREDTVFIGDEQGGNILGGLVTEDYPTRGHDRFEAVEVIVSENQAATGPRTRP